MTNSISTLLKSSLFSFGPFFTYPWKPILNLIYGDSYKIGYKHFYDQHKHPTNLIMHTICLFFQLFGNFALLSEVDKLLLQGKGYLQVISAALWIFCSVLPPKETPSIVKLISSLCIVSACILSPGLTGPNIEIAGLAAVFLSFLVHIVKYGSVKIDKQGILILVVGFVGKWIIYNRLIAGGFLGILSEHTKTISVGWLSCLTLLAAKKNPLKAVVIAGAIGSTILSVLVNQPILTLFNCAFSATLLQGLSHSLSGETATLIKLEDEEDEAKKLSFEYAHAVYFPNVLLQSIYENITGKKSVE